MKPQTERGLNWSHTSPVTNCMGWHVQKGQNPQLLIHIIITFWIYAPTHSQHILCAHWFVFKMCVWNLWSLHNSLFLSGQEFLVFCYGVLEWRAKSPNCRVAYSLEFSSKVHTYISINRRGVHQSAAFYTHISPDLVFFWLSECVVVECIYMGLRSMRRDSNMKCQLSDDFKIIGSWDHHPA